MKKTLRSQINGQPPVNPSGEESQSQKGSQAFPVAGIGASADGLEALEQFLRHVPDTSGIAYINAYRPVPGKLSCIFTDITGAGEPGDPA